jgi:NADPH:quinone reductase-like Zn-dependent oxidoreductase
MASEQEVIRGQTVLCGDRFDLTADMVTMKAVVTIGNGGPEMLEYRDVPVPRPGPGEVLLQVLAAGVNNTEINTRLGWYSSSVTASTESAAEAEEREAVAKDDGGWSAPTPFPLIQGTDCCGRVVEVGPGGDESIIGRRVMVRPCMRPLGFGSMENIWMASDFDGAFAQFVKVPASEVFAVECDLSDVELGAMPCAYGTAENMLHRAGVTGAEHVVVTGASGGVGSAAVPLAKRRGAAVTAVAARAKAEQVRALAADRVIDRDDDIVAALGERSVDVVVDNVSRPAFGGLLDVLERGGRYVSSGASGGPIVTLDKRTFYLKDLTLIGCTAWDEPVFPDLVSYIERGEVRPLVAKTFPLESIADAQREFLEKRHVGNFVLIPPSPEG